ncbi:Fibronectin type III domain-containing protein [Sinosporangium album]|uniref:Fibronectin type III domain-containing protein n=1 Tax=Sinosporangium album TaxID=504805 RepID=A0A1G8EGM9_9ACTN|nr:fibronectin type III domain-containing protein [Sinosporangium album]SDH69021.1 Fibronectin type III domain-containing protein [Sinosporangium album]
MGRIWRAQKVEQGLSAYTVVFPQPATAGNRLIARVVSYYGPGSVTSGWEQLHSSMGYSFAGFYSKIAEGGETSFTVQSSGGAVIVAVEERDDAANVLAYATYYQNAANIWTPDVTIPAGQGVLMAVVGRVDPGDIGASVWPYHFDSADRQGFGTTMIDGEVHTGPLPAPTTTPYSFDYNVSAPTEIVIVAFGTTDPTPPTAPPNLRASIITGTSITAAWDPATDNIAVTGYGVYLDNVKQGADQTDLTRVFDGLTTGQTYRIEVDARDAAGNRSPKARIDVMAIVDTVPPTVPPNFRTTSIGHTTVAVAWDPATDNVGVAGYGVYLDGVKQGGDQTDLTYTFSGLARGTTYSLAVDAVDVSGWGSNVAELVVSTLADTLPSIPPGFAATAGREQVTLAWQAATDDLGVARYEILLDGDTVAATGALGHVIDGLDAGGVYEVGVRAVDEAGGRGPAATLTVQVPAAGWVAASSPVYRLGGWVGNAVDEHGVLWTVTYEDGWSSSPEVSAFAADLDSGDGGFTGEGRFTARLITLEGEAVAPTRAAMLAAQERLTGVLHPRETGVLRVAEAHATRQAVVRLAADVQVTDTGPLSFDWTLTLSAADPRRYAVRGTYQEAVVEPLPGAAQVDLVLHGDYPHIPAVVRVFGPIRDFTITHVESGLVIRSKPGTVLPADPRYSFEINLSTPRVVWAHVPPEVWPEPRPGRNALAVLPARFALQPGWNTLTLAGEPVPGEVGSPRLVVEAADAWR